MSELLLDRAGRRRSPATLPGFQVGHAPGNKGLLYPADPPKVEEIIAVMRAAGDATHGRRLRGLIVILWRAGLRTQKALALAEGDLDQRRGDRAGRRRSPATLPGFHAGHVPGNKDLRYPADPPKVEEIISVMRAAGDDRHGRRLRGRSVRCSASSTAGHG